MTIIAMAQGLPVLLCAGVVVANFDPIYSFLGKEIASELPVQIFRMIVVVVPGYFVDLYINMILLIEYFQISLFTRLTLKLVLRSIKQQQKNFRNHNHNRSDGIFEEVNRARAINSSRKFFTKLSLLCSLINETYSYQLPSLMMFGASFLILCNYACVKMVGNINMLFTLAFFGTGLFAITIIAAISPLLESVFENSSLFLRNMRTVAGQHTLLRRQVSSCRPCRIVMCPLFFAKKSTKCSYFDNCLQFTMNVLLLF